MNKLTKKTFQFLSEIKKNNRRDWFLENKGRYTNIRDELFDFGEALMHKLMSFDKSLQDPHMKPYIFRIYRDARFAKGRPYKNNLGLMLLKGGRPAMSSRAGYYLHIEPGNCFLGGGAHMPTAEWLNSIRESIMEKPRNFQKI